VTFNASVFAIASAAAGGAFALTGGTPGHLAFPGDYGPLLALVCCYYLCNTLLVSAIIAAGSRSAFRPLALDTLRHALPTAAGESGLGVALALAAFFEPWAVLTLAPLVFAVYQAHARLATLRRETARALETFANVVDERDASTFRHSARVAEHVHRLAQALRLPAAEVARIRWAGRLHDLGKIAVDGAVLLKPGALDPHEWQAMRRHARLSARLLRRFRFAAGEARAVEYHHERYDGQGYYRVDGTVVPIAAHFLIVADAFDAMTSDRSYRKGLPTELALAEIEKAAGTQFHPIVAKAFVALVRGSDPLSVLTPAERHVLHSSGITDRPETLPDVLRRLARRQEAGAAIAVAGALTAFGLGSRYGAALGGIVALSLLALRLAHSLRARDLRVRLLGTLTAASDTELIARLACELVPAGLAWAGLVAWREQDLAAVTEIAHTCGSDGPPDSALSSWLLREAEASEGLLVAPARELGHPGQLAVVRFRASTAVAGYLVLLFSGATPQHVELALAGCLASMQERLGQQETAAASHRVLRAA
jgi:putative nucleotidyltransferase with HDIG domain